MIRTQQDYERDFELAQRDLEEAQKDTTKILCKFCEADGNVAWATAFAPQMISGHLEEPVWNWVPVCNTHREGWWDCSDFEVRPHPPIAVIGLFAKD